MSAITGNTVRTGSLWDAGQPVVHTVIPSLDPSEIVHMAEEGPTPSLLHIAVLMQKWVPLRLLIDLGAPSQMSWKSNPQECQEFCDRFVSVQRLDGVDAGDSDGAGFLLPRGCPDVPAVFQDDGFQPLQETPYSAATKPIAIFFIANDWAGYHSGAISKLFAKAYRRHYAEIAKHLTVVRVLIDHPSQIVPTLKKVKALLPGVPVLHVSTNGHSREAQQCIILSRDLRMTVSDVKNAFKNEVHKRLRKSAGDEAEVRTQLLSDVATKNTRFPGTAYGLAAISPEFIQEIAAEIAPKGSFLFKSCHSAAGDSNLASAFSDWAPEHTVYGCPDSASNIIPKVFHTRNGIPQLIPFYLKVEKSKPGMAKMYLRAYRNGKLRVDVSGEFPSPLSNPTRRPSADIDRSLFMGIDMTEEESNDPNWQQLTQAIGNPNRPAFAGSVCILAHDRKVCSHRSKKAKTDETP